MGHHGRTGEDIISEAPRYQPPLRVVGQIACSDADGFHRPHLLCAFQDHREGYGRGLRWASQSSDAGKHLATSRREIERFIRFLPLINVLQSFESVHDPGQRAGQQHRRRRCARQGDTEQQLRDKGTATKIPTIGCSYRRRAPMGDGTNWRRLRRGTGANSIKSA